MTSKRKRAPRRPPAFAGALRAVKRIHRVVKAVDRWTGRAQRVALNIAKKGAKSVKGWVKAHKRAGVAIRAHRRRTHAATTHRPATKKPAALARPAVKRAPVAQLATKPAPAVGPGKPAAPRQPSTKQRASAAQQRLSEAAQQLGKEMQRISDEQWRQARHERGL
jgi:hypothetical protein